MFTLKLLHGIIGSDIGFGLGFRVGFFWFGLVFAFFFNLAKFWKWNCWKFHVLQIVKGVVRIFWKCIRSLCIYIFFWCLEKRNWRLFSIIYCRRISWLALQSSEKWEKPLLSETCALIFVCSCLLACMEQMPSLLIKHFSMFNNGWIQGDKNFTVGMPEMVDRIDRCSWFNERK